MEVHKCTFYWIKDFFFTRVTNTPTSNSDRFKMIEMNHSVSNAWKHTEISELWQTVTCQLGLRSAETSLQLSLCNSRYQSTWAACGAKTTAPLLPGPSCCRGVSHTGMCGCAWIKQPHSGAESTIRRLLASF